MKYYWAKKYEALFFFLLVTVLFARVASNFNDFSYAISVWLPIVFIPLSMIYAIFFLKIRSKVRSVKVEEILFLIISSFLILIPIIHFVFFENLIDSEGRYSDNYIFVTSALAVSWMFAGSVIAKMENNFKTSVIIICFLLSLFYFIKGFGGGYFIDYYYLSSLRSDGIKIHHLSLTEPLVYIFFLVISISSKNIYIKWVVLLLVTYLMLALGGRVAFFSFIATVFLYEIALSKRFFLIKLSLISIFLLTMIFTFKGLISDSYAYKKLFFEDGIANDSSFEARISFFKDFYQGFLSQFLVGDVNYFIEKHNNLGTYAHNILSVFQFYGLVPFISILYTFYYIFKNIFRYKIYQSTNVVNIFGCLLLVYSFISILIGKAVLFSSMWFVIGFWLVRLRSLKVKNYV